MDNKSTILITGAVSLLGKYLWLNLKNQYRIVFTSRNSPIDTTFKNAEFQHLDVTNKKMVKQVFEKIQPDVVIHLASLSNIDYCESNPKEAYQVNVKGTRNVCEAFPPHLIFISSSMVFHGDSAPYKESDKSNPVNVYGRTKAEAEKIVQASGLASTILRFSTLFGYPPQGARDNDLTHYLKKLKQIKPLHLVNDRFYNPLSAKTAAEVIKKIINQQITGVFHAGGKNRVNRFEFVQMLIQAFNLINPPEIFSVPNDFFKHLAPRPINITLTTEKMESRLDVTPQTLNEELMEIKNAD